MIKRYINELYDCVAQLHVGGNFYAGLNVGGSFYASGTGTGATGFEARLGYGFKYQSESFNLGIGSTYFASGETSQLNGFMHAGGGNWKLTYENDTWAPVPGLLIPGGADRDRFRTAALRFDVTGGKLKGANAGLFLYTGLADEGFRPGGNGNGVFNGPGANRYRLGAIYGGYKNIRLGYNSEKNIRGPIQNNFHNLFSYPHFEVLNIPDKIYGGIYSSNPFTLW